MKYYGSLCIHVFRSISQLLLFHFQILMESQSVHMQKVKPLTSQVAHRNRLISGGIASIYSNSKAKAIV